MTRYAVKEVFNTIQGEGARAGSRAVFVRFAGCNLWDGVPAHRARGIGPCAQWCDTDFAKGTPTSTPALLAQMDALWSAAHGQERWCVLTGGEPCLQLDCELLRALATAGWRTAVETNGTVANEAVGAHADWVCIAPKRGTKWGALGRADELKLVLPGDAEGGWSDAELLAVALAHPTAQLFVQPQDPLLTQEVAATFLLGGRAAEAEAIWQRNYQRCLAWVYANPRWRLGAQLHKFFGLA